jgi:hypothetical protein
MAELRTTVKNVALAFWRKYLNRIAGDSTLASINSRVLLWKSLPRYGSRLNNRISAYAKALVSRPIKLTKIDIRIWFKKFYGAWFDVIMSKVVAQIHKRLLPRPLPIIDDFLIAVLEFRALVSFLNFSLVIQHAGNQVIFLLPVLQNGTLGY